MKDLARGGGVWRQLRAVISPPFRAWRISGGHRSFVAQRVSATLSVVLVLLCLFGKFPSGDFWQVQAQEHSLDDGLTAKVLSLERLWNEAEIAKDTQSLDHLLADAFIYADIDGSVLSTKADFLHSVTDRSERIDSIRSESMLTRVYGDTVIVTGIYHEKGTVNGKPYTHHGRFTDTWVKQGSGWLCAASQSTLLQK